MKKIKKLEALVGQNFKLLLVFYTKVQVETYCIIMVITFRRIEGDYVRLPILQ
jgi:hypothetical protein